MLQAARTPKLNLYTYSDVEEVTGFVGNFTVKVRKRARYVTNDCNGCGACYEVCPAFGYNEFNEGMDSRRAIYSAFAQAVPSLAQIDMDRCIKCELCKGACEVDAIDFDQKDELLEFEVGSIIVATKEFWLQMDQQSDIWYGLQMGKNQKKFYLFNVLDQEI